MFLLFRFLNTNCGHMRQLNCLDIKIDAMPTSNKNLFKPFSDIDFLSIAPSITLLLTSEIYCREREQFNPLLFIYQLSLV